jgi:hypothetical protein
MPRAHRLRRGLPGYLIPFAPHAVVPDRQEMTSTLPSPLVFPPISTHFTAPPGVPCASSSLKRERFARGPEVEPPDLTRDYSHRLRALYAQ